MAEVFRIEKTKNYTVMSNTHLRDCSISLKAKGLLSQLLSLPNDWTINLKGLAQINKESISAISSAVKELIDAGDIVREEIRNAKSQFQGYDYIVYEAGREHFLQENRESENPKSENPKSENLKLEKPEMDNQAQLNTNITTTRDKKDRKNKDDDHHHKADLSDMCITQEMQDYYGLERIVYLMRECTPRSVLPQKELELKCDAANLIIKALWLQAHSISPNATKAASPRALAKIVLQMSPQKIVRPMEFVATCLENMTEEELQT